MAGDLTLVGAVPKHILALQQAPQDEFDIPGSSGPSFPALSFRQGRWRVRAGDEEKVLKTKEGNNLAAVTAAVIAANPGTYKAYYKKAFDPKADKAEAPVCWSANGVSPSSSCTEKQSALCANCPQNQFGSKISEKGSKVKACTDSKRLLVLPFSEDLGLSDAVHVLNVPIMSRKNWMAYMHLLKQHNVPLRAVVTKFSLDEDTDYPLLQFAHAGWLTEDQIATVTDVMDDPDVMQFRAGDLDIETTAPRTLAHEPEPAKAEPTKPAKVTKLDRKQAAPAPAPAPEPEATETDDSLSDMDDMMKQIDAIDF